MLFPYSTDAPIYHFPFATIGLIVVNTLIFFGMLGMTADIDVETPTVFDHFMLEFDTIAPWQWLTNNFLHGSLMHLISNMIFLWSFGLIVEGKLGWLRFLLIYVLVGVVYGAVIQVGMFLFSDGEGGALGASAVIFGLMALAVIWAPKNDLHCAAWITVPRLYEIPILAFGLFYLGLQIVFLALRKFSMSSELLHITGIAIGVPLGILYLKRGWVDCEGWDLFSVLAGNEGKHNPAREKQLAEAQLAMEDATKRRRQTVLASIKQAIDDGKPLAALAILEKQSELFTGEHQIPLQMLLALVNELHRQKQWAASVSLMFELIERAETPPVGIQLKLAQILLQAMNRPSKALRLLQALPDDLTPDQAAMRHKLIAKAEEARESEDAELELED